MKTEEMKQQNKNLEICSAYRIESIYTINFVNSLEKIIGNRSECWKTEKVGSPLSKEKEANLQKVEIVFAMFLRSSSW
jgi:hypothetical protein